MFREGIMKFVNRYSELRFLEDAFARDGFQFIPIYGRRRVGKTRLVREFLQGKRGIYFLADAASEREQLKNLGAQGILVTAIEKMAD